MMEYNNLESGEINKKQFILDMISMSRSENYAFAKRLLSNAEMLKELSDIAREIGDIKQSVDMDISKIAKKFEVDWNVNNLEYAKLILRKDDKF